jgi:hypothetical protein
LKKTGTIDSDAEYVGELMLRRALENYLVSQRLDRNDLLRLYSLLTATRNEKAHARSKAAHSAFSDYRWQKHSIGHWPRRHAFQVVPGRIGAR